MLLASCSGGWYELMLVANGKDRRIVGQFFKSIFFFSDKSIAAQRPSDLLVAVAAEGVETAGQHHRVLVVLVASTS
jgi:hypothetical protein